LQKIACTDIELLSNIRRSFTSRDELYRDMSVLMTLLPDVLFVTHVDARQSSGEHIQSRSDFIANIQTVAKDLGAKLYNPTSAMRFVGQDLAIAKDDPGLAHYSAAFEDLIAHDLGRSLLPDSSRSLGKTANLADPVSKLFQIAGVRQSKPVHTTKMLANLFDQSPDLASPALLEHARIADVSNTMLERLIPHLSQLDRLELWAAHGVGPLSETSSLTDLQITKLIARIGGDKRTAKLDELLTQLDRKASSVLSKALRNFLTYNFASRFELLDAAKTVLKHDPSNPVAKGAIYHLKTWLSAQDHAAGTSSDLTEWANLNARLPLPNSGVDLAIARNHFASGDCEQAIRIGLRVKEQAPENLTLAVMLMRAAQQSSDPRAIQFAQNVESLTSSGTKYRIEAEKITNPQALQA